MFCVGLLAVVEANHTLPSLVPSVLIQLNWLLRNQVCIFGDLWREKEGKQGERRLALIGATAGEGQILGVVSFLRERRAQIPKRNLHQSEETENKEEEQKQT